MARILLIIPAYNEQDNILNTYQSIVRFNQLHNTNYEVIVINDCSKDNTKSILEYNHIPYIDLVHNLGIGGAVQTGYKYAYENDYDIAVQFDGDGQHDVNYVESIVQPILNKEADFVIGSRFVDKDSSEFKSSSARRIGIKLISFFIKLVTGKKIFDTTSGFRAANKNVISLFAQKYPTEYPEPITTTELLKMRLVCREIAVKMHERQGGESSIKAWKSIYYMINVVANILVVGTRRYRSVK